MNFRITEQALREFAKELGFTVGGIRGSHTVWRKVDGSYNGPCPNRENMAYLRGVRDGRRHGSPA